METRTYVEVHRLDVSEHLRRPFLGGLAHMPPGVQLVLTTPAWPAGPPGQEWLAWLTDVATAAASASGMPVILAELTAEVFDALRAGAAPELLAASSLRLDQVFRANGIREAATTRELHRTLDRRGSRLISEQLVRLGIVAPAHIKLRCGWHIDREVRLRSFGALPGGDGLRRYLLSFYARRLVLGKPEVIAYLGDPVRHPTMHSLMKGVGRALALRGSHPTLLRLRGPASHPQADAEELARVPPDGRIVIAADLTASGHEMNQLYRALVDGGLHPRVIAPLLTFAFTPDLRQVLNNRSITIISAPVLQAKAWPEESDCPLCPIAGPAKLADPESHVAPQRFVGEPYQIARGRFWRSMVLGGRVGIDPADDRRHLHDSYLAPNMSERHIDALLELVLKELTAMFADKPFGIVYHENATCEAMMLATKRAFSDLFPHLPTYPVSRVDGVWQIDHAFKEVEVGRLPVIVFDDAVTTGESAMALLFALHRRGLDVRAFIACEDKASPAVRDALERLCEVGAYADTADGSPTQLYFLHRSPYFTPAFNEGHCATCERRRLLRAVVGRGRRPASARDALAALISPSVWPCSDRPATEDDEDEAEYDIQGAERGAAELNWLLSAEPDLVRHPRRMDIIVNDFLPQLREEGLPGQIAGLHEEWRRRLMLRLTTDELADVPEETLTNDDVNTAYEIGSLAASDSPDAVRATMLQLCTRLEGDDGLAERYYSDLVERFCGFLVGRDDRLACVEAALRVLERCTAPTLRQLRDDLGALQELLPGLPSSATATMEFTVPNGPLERVTEPAADALRSGAGAIDLTDTPFRFEQDARSTPLDHNTGLTWAITAVKGQVSTREATGFFVEAEGITRVQAKNIFTTQHRRAEKAIAHPVVIATRERSKKNPELCLESAFTRGVVRWPDLNRPPWSTLTAWAELHGDSHGD